MGAICPKRILEASRTRSPFRLFLGEGDLHGVGLGDLEALQGLPGSARLHLVIKLHEGDVVPPGHQTHLFEAGEPAADGRFGKLQNSQTGAQTVNTFYISEPKKAARHEYIKCLKQ